MGYQKVFDNIPNQPSENNKLGGRITNMLMNRKERITAVIKLNLNLPG